MEQGVHKIIKRVLIVVILLACSFFIFKNVKYLKTANSISFFDIARNQLKKDAQILDSIFITMSNKAVDLGTIMSKVIDERQIKKDMGLYCGENEIDGLIFACEVIDSDQNFAYLAIKNFELKFVDISQHYDFRSENCFWYTEAIKTGKIYWTNVIFDPAYGEKIVMCCAPFTVGKHRGVIAVIYRTTSIFGLLNNHCGIGRYGFPYITDSSAKFIAHPQDESRSLEELGYEFDDDVLIKYSDAIRTNNIDERGFVHYNTATQKKCAELAYPLDNISWFLGLSVYDGRELESQIFRRDMRQTILKILFLLFVSFISVLILVKPFFENTYLNVICSIALLLGIITIISIYNRFPTHSGKLKEKTDNVYLEKWETTRITEKQSLTRFIDGYYKGNYERFRNNAIHIPTGLFINTMQMLDDYDIRITGYIWQKYYVSKDDTRKDYIPDIYYPNKGVVFPEAKINTHDLVDTLYILQNNELMMLYRWQFDIEVKEQFSHSLYPFGKHEIGIQFWSNSLDDNSILIPDIESYAQLYPDVCAGINERIVLNGWNIIASYFSYHHTSYLCNFGNTQTAGMSDFPELYFNIIVSRKFIDNLVCRIIPLMVVLILLFTILFVRQESDSFNIVIGTASLFFVLIFEHINLRQNISSEEIMFIEYCYFFSYAMLLIVTTTSFKIEKSFLYKKFELYDKFLKQYFWTLILGAMFVAALLLFY